MTDFRLCRLFILLLFAAAFSGCATVSFDEPKSYSKTITDTVDTSLGRDVSAWAEVHGGLSGFYPLNQSMDALGVRLRLAELAEKSIDMQYFLMEEVIETREPLTSPGLRLKARFLRVAPESQL